MENMDVLRANGFEVTVDEEQAPGRGERIKLSAMPVSKDTTFDFKGEPVSPVVNPSLGSVETDDRPGTAHPSLGGRSTASRANGPVFQSQVDVCQSGM